jgi:hypothetical protein
VGPVPLLRLSLSKMGDASAFILEGQKGIDHGVTDKMDFLFLDAFFIYA